MADPWTTEEEFDCCPKCWENDCMCEDSITKMFYSTSGHEETGPAYYGDREEDQNG